MNDHTIPINIVDPSPQAGPSLHLPKLGDDDYYSYHNMVKPTGSLCNLDCTYCFYLHKEQLLNQSKRPRMAPDLLELHIRQYMEANTGPSVDFTWQGGEPTLAGLDFYKRVVSIQQKYKRPDQIVYNDLQTNGLLLNDEWCQFLKEHDFLVGLSIDGPAEFHDRYRYTKTKMPTHAKVMEKVALLHQYGISFNALCVVNRDNAQQPLAVYRFLRDQVKPNIIQFIPGIETKDFESVAPGQWDPDKLPLISSPAARPGNEDSVVTDWSVDPIDWGNFLCTIWDEWFQRDFGRTFVDQFENVISIMFNHGPQKCVNAQVCGKAVAIEHNGDIYSCDHFVYPEYKLGNIQHTHQGDLVFSAAQKKFGFAKFESLPKHCNQCFFLNLCWGECPKSRFIRTPDGEAGLSYLCSGLKLFYAKATNAYPTLKKRLQL